MRKLRNCFIALLFGCSAPALIWVGAGAALYQWRKEANLLKRAVADSLCRMDNDCPLGFVCISGRCVPARAR